MDLSGVVLVLEAIGHELVGILDPVHELALSLDHALVDELLERFGLANVAQVIEELVPETGVDEVTGGVLGTTDVEVHVAPVLIVFPAYQRLVVVRIHVAEVVRAAAGETGHGAGLDGIALVGPVLGTCQGRFAGLRGKELVDFGKFQRQAFVRHGAGNAVLVIDRERLAPIALAREDGVTQAVIDLAAAQAVRFDIVDGGGDGFLDGHAIEETGIAHDARLGVKAAFGNIASFDDGHDGQVESPGENIVTAVVRRNGHDGAGAIAGQHVFGDPNRNLFT